MTTGVTASGQPIVLPRSDAEVVVARARWRVSNTETGKSEVYETGAFIVEAAGQWHRGANIGSEPVKLPAIDMTPPGESNVVKK